MKDSSLTKRKIEVEKYSECCFGNRGSGGEKTQECPGCGSKNIVRDYKRAEIFCADCGLVITEDIVDFGPEWNAFDWKEKMERIRTGPSKNARFSGKRLGTEIVPKGLSGLRILDKRSYGVNESSAMNFALWELDRIAIVLGLPVDIREIAADFYRKAAKKGLVNGRRMDDFISAVLYITCKQSGLPRTLREIEKASGIKPKKISHACHLLEREFNLRSCIAVPVPNNMIFHFCSELGLSREIGLRVMEVIGKERNEIANGKNLAGVVAGAFYITARLCGENCTQKEIANVAGVTEVTLRNGYKELL